METDERIQGMPPPAGIELFDLSKAWPPLLSPDELVEQGCDDMPPLLSRHELMAELDYDGDVACHHEFCCDDTVM